MLEDDTNTDNNEEGRRKKTLNRHFMSTLRGKFTKIGSNFPESNGTFGETLKNVM